MAMPMEHRADYTVLLAQASAGDPRAAGDFFRLAYGELRRMAGGAMRDEMPGHVLQPTALVHEAFLRVWDDGVRWENRRHFFGAAARSMRQILVDEARRRATEKHGGAAQRVSLSAADRESGLPGAERDLMRLDALLAELERLHPRYPRLVELRHFAGFGIEETADLLDVSPATVKRDWAFVRAWLLDRLAP